MFRLDVVTPDRVVMGEDVVSLVAPGALGSFGVLTGHAPMVAELGIGPLRYRTPAGQEETVAVSGGFLEVARNRVVVLADAAERANEIDVERAVRARDRAREAADPHDAEQNRAALARAENRLRIAGR